MFEWLGENVCDGSNDYFWNTDEEQSRKNEIISHKEAVKVFFLVTNSHPWLLHMHMWTACTYIYMNDASEIVFVHHLCWELQQ